MHESGSIPLHSAIVQQLCKATVSHEAPDEELLDELPPDEEPPEELEELLLEDELGRGGGVNISVPDSVLSL